MKKKGFTLIELLAVIVIMGILMFAAIPAINRTIENARKDQYVNLAQNYARAVETLWYADGLECKNGGPSYQKASALSALDDEGYFVIIDSANPPVQLLQQGGKSPWGNKDVQGYVQIYFGGEQEPHFYPALFDGIHVINGNADNEYLSLDRRYSIYNEASSFDIYDGDISGSGYSEETINSRICRVI